MLKMFLALFLTPFLLQATDFIQWQKPQMKAQGGHAQHGGHGGAQKFEIGGFDADATYEVRYITSTLEALALEPKNGIVTPPRTGLNNYHALVVNEKCGDVFSSSVRYIYGHGKPSKTSPTKLTHLQKSELEIVPSPLPREHDRYTASKSYDFLLRFKGKPLQNIPIILNTQNGSELHATSGKKGTFAITLPNDFKAVKEDRGANKPAEFFLKAAYTSEGMQYATTLAMPYHVNPNDYWRSEPLGALLIVVGMIAGWFIMRRYVHNKRKA